MKNSYYLLTALIIMLSVPENVTGQYSDQYSLNRYIENPSLVGENQESPHVPLFTFETEDKALSGKKDYYLSLNGTWKFKWYKTPLLAKDEFQKKDFDPSGWENIQVPGTWQMQGYGYKIYRNIPMEFSPFDPPRVPDHLNPTGCYVREFNIPESWKGKNIYVSFEGVKSAYWLRINGQYCGFDKGSMTTGEFDISKLVKTGRNTISVKVVRWSDGSYLEDQDMWRFSGIYRDVYICARPKIHVHDIAIQTDFSDTYDNAELLINLKMSNTSNREIDKANIRIRIFDKNNTVIANLSSRIKDIRPGTLKEQIIKSNIDNPVKWSAEKPYLYKAVVVLKDSEDNIQDIVSETFGFREVEIKNGLLLVNGYPVKLKGVNRHEHHPKTGRTMDRETILKDMTLMKQLNINAIRLSHYPNLPLFYELADELGFYVIDEVNAECHFNEGFIAHQPGWDKSFMDRTMRMYHRDKNHPSVIMWSTGNECGTGPIHYEMASYLKQIDNTRPVMAQNNIPVNGDAPFADVNGIRYPSPEVLEYVADTCHRPVIMGEYSHNMGNSLGHFDEYWNRIFSIPNLQGGFIWDWVNQGLEMDFVTTPDGSKYNHLTNIMGHTEHVNGKYGKALALSGIDDWIEICPDPVFNQSGDDLSVSLWVYPRMFINKNSFISKGLSWDISQTHKDTICFTLQTSAGTFRLYSRLPADWQNNWHQLSSSYNGNEMKIFIDEKKTGSRQAEGQIVRNRNPVTIGKNHKINHENHPGFTSNSIFDEIKIWNKALEQDDINKIPPAGKEDLILWLPFDTINKNGTFLSYGATPQGSGTMDGIINADRTLQPEAYQLKKSHSPVKIQAKDIEKGLFMVTNRFHFTSLDEVDISWYLIQHTDTLKKGSLDLQTRPGQSEVFSIDLNTAINKISGFSKMLFSYSLPENIWWADKGYEVSFDEFVLSRKSILAEKITSNEGLIFEEGLEEITFSGDTFRYTINKKSGALCHITINDAEIITSDMLLHAWRAPIMNELSEWNTSETAWWYELGLDSLVHKVKSIEIKDNDKIGYEVNVMARSYSHMKRNVYFDQVLNYIFSNNGDIKINHQIECHVNYEWFHGDRPVPYLPLLGLKTRISDKVKKVEWLGKGPFETYPDRKTGAKTGFYLEKLSDILFPYLIPQDFGNKTDVQWSALLTESNSGIMIVSDDVMNFNIYPYENPDQAWYPFQLSRSDGYVFELNKYVTGVGGTPVPVRDKYRVFPGYYEYSVYIRPLHNGISDLKEIFKK